MIRPMLISLVACLLVSCHSSIKKESASQSVMPNSQEDLYGKITKDQLYLNFPSWQEEERSYPTFKPAMSELHNIEGEFRVEIFLGTWCSDSKREVPRFFKIMAEAKVASNLKIDLWAVDRNKMLDTDLTHQREIEYVPTFIFYFSDKEIGRIIESSEGLLEEDILNILNRARN